MALVTCVRCGQTQEGLPRAPFPGDVGQAVLERVCQPCWSEWLTTQVRIINEYGLQLYNPTHRAELTRVMKQFLNLQDE